MVVSNPTKDIIHIQGLWDYSKCQSFIKASEIVGYGPALVETGSGQKRVDHVRNNQRVIYTDEDLAEELWEEVKAYIPATYGISKAVGLNEMFRFYKYESGQEFKKHRDQSFIRNEQESSFFTLLIYLNEGFEGGETSFADLTIVPRTGDCLIFSHQQEHEGAKLKSGVKYVLRTDVMFHFDN